MACHLVENKTGTKQTAGNARRPLRVDASQMCTGRRGLRINLGKGKSETRERRPAKLGSDPPNEVLCWAWHLSGCFKFLCWATGVATWNGEKHWAGLFKNGANTDTRCQVCPRARTSWLEPGNKWCAEKNTGRKLQVASRLCAQSGKTRRDPGCAIEVDGMVDGGWWLFPSSEIPHPEPRGL
jgi:hypothetical protein